MDEPLRLVGESAGEEALSVAEPLSFEAFFEAEARTLFRRLCTITGNAAEAEEVMQDAFLNLFERWDRMDEVGDPRAYLYRTAFNAWKRRSRRASRALRVALSPGSHHDDVDAVDTRTVVAEALARLTPRQRAAMVLTELIGFSSEEAGEILGIRPVTARVLTSQARAAMREYLGERDG